VALYRVRSVLTDRRAATSHGRTAGHTEDLLEQVWDEHADPFTNTVSVTISRLRRKLGDPPVIETIPNVGYQMKAG
jgi:DNA-binding response OmpR family regulator